MNINMEDPEKETVYRIKNRKSGKGFQDGTAYNGQARTGNPSVYHTERDCRHIKNAEITPITRSAARRKGLGMCQNCKGEAQSKSNPGITCPFCGEHVFSLPNHLPCEGVEENDE